MRRARDTSPLGDVNRRLRNARDRYARRLDMVVRFQGQARELAGEIRSIEEERRVLKTASKPAQESADLHGQENSRGSVT